MLLLGEKRDGQTAGGHERRRYPIIKHLGYFFPKMGDNPGKA
jgi:hypothetical protein